MAAFLEFALALAPEIVDHFAVHADRGPADAVVRAVKATVKIAAFAAILL